MRDPHFFYREAAIRGASKVRLVILLYEQMIRDLNRALLAVEQNKIERRTEAINHAITVIGHLQGTLDLDLKSPVVQHLMRFYTTLRAGLLEAHRRASGELLKEQISYLLEMREAWEQVDRAETGRSVEPPVPGFAAVADWNG